MGVWAAVITGAVAAIWDIKTRRVPNWLTYGAVGLGLALGSLHGWPGLLNWLAGMATGFFALYVPYVILGGLGEGDLKLMAAFGALGGPAFAFWSAVYGSVLGGVGAFMFLFFTGRLRKTLAGMSAWALGVLGGGGAELPEPELFIPYAPFLAAGALLAFLLKGGAFV